MIGYRDRQWCDKYKTCAKGKGCDRALTPKVQKAADEWWGKGDNQAQIDLPIGKPLCWVAK